MKNGETSCLNNNSCYINAGIKESQASCSCLSCRCLSKSSAFWRGLYNLKHTHSALFFFLIRSQLSCWVMTEQFHKVNPFHIEAFCDQTALETSSVTQKEEDFTRASPVIPRGLSPNFPANLQSSNGSSWHHEMMYFYPNWNFTTQSFIKSEAIHEVFTSSCP